MAFAILTLSGTLCGKELNVKILKLIIFYLPAIIPVKEESTISSVDSATFENLESELVIMKYTKKIKNDKNDTGKQFEKEFQ